MADLTPNQKALIYDQDDVVIRTEFDAYTVSIDDPTIAAIIDGGNWQPAVAGVAAGACTLTVVRNSDGAQATLPITVAEVTFAVHLGTPSPK